MNYWLVKSEPFKYSWDQFVKDKVATWDGVRNYQARNNLQGMKKGDKVLFYHSNEGMEVVGIATVAKEYYQDPTTPDPKWVVVDLKPLKPFKQFVTLAQMKAEKKLAGLSLIRQGRLSVCDLTPEEFEVIMEMGGMK
ncbi:putative RNA-binding protein with PUA-like domain [Chitinophaga niastensis]|uniref:Putative RNA-binding protein with PUA-like domain n=1 Tax=Chitinophaga niastensis TaxID=536980 RepID=A0A2P8HAV1_CHINA|nr:EVE domain-containing protein [Chitinophaga niastensis]PSL43355.1 putative RNA-binding protein with PUA-like domain [Chitinophaga niastensis]